MPSDGREGGRESPTSVRGPSEAEKANRVAAAAAAACALPLLVWGARYQHPSLNK